MKIQAGKQKYKGWGWGKSQKHTTRVQKHNRDQNTQAGRMLEKLRHVLHKGDLAADQREMDWYIYWGANEGTEAGELRGGQVIRPAEI